MYCRINGMARYALNRMHLQWPIPVRGVRDHYLLYGECENGLQPYTYLRRSWSTRRLPDAHHHKSRSWINFQLLVVEVWHPRWLTMQNSLVTPRLHLDVRSLQLCKWGREFCHLQWATATGSAYKNYVHISAYEGKGFDHHKPHDTLHTRQLL